MHLVDRPPGSGSTSGRLTVQVVNVVGEGKQWRVSLDLATWDLTEK